MPGHAQLIEANGATTPLPITTVDSHTISISAGTIGMQLTGASADGRVRALAAGVLVDPTSTSAVGLATTGGNIEPLTRAGGAALLLGLALALAFRARRRRLLA